MEAFSLLKYWRTTPTTTPDSTANTRATTKTIVASAAAVTTYSSSDGEDGPYFDLEFSHPDQDSDAEQEPSAKTQQSELQVQNSDENETETETESDDDEEEEEEEEEEGELKFAVASNECADENHVALSPSDELFFKGDLVSIEPSSILLNGPEENSKFPVNLLKSATKFRVLLLKLKKSKSEKIEEEGAAERENNSSHGKVSSRGGSGKFFTVKFKVEEVSPLVSLFARDNSSKEIHNSGKEESDTNMGSDDQKKLAKEILVQKYLKMVKPFYVRVSKRYVEKLKFSGHLGSKGGGGGAPAPPSPAAEKGGEGDKAAAPINVKNHSKQGNMNLQAGLKVVRKHLRKSRSASAAVSAAPPAKMTASNRRDDSLLQLQDGIQGAILHCKKSFNASRVTHKSYATYEEAQMAFKATEECNVQQNNKGKQKVQIPQKGIPVADRVKGVMTLTQRMELKKVTFQKFQRNLDMLINYSDVNTTMGFYPINFS
ncbi:hypothetical protein BUALT_Bualt10G0058000 [Buddleja alternifolia]|uniref:Membrane-associated kinase regulator 2 n=1 Tax=Buddleja alternifolia TaxID=168488 RepID=A0AAV6X3M2_9LAMI|nr:hypothetical protein BUALT_Bualt10G0058000 [Buddleja alternifolia]